jgi:hypothetical protein
LGVAKLPLRPLGSWWLGSRSYLCDPLEPAWPTVRLGRIRHQRWTFLGKTQRVTLNAVDAISAMVAPVVLLTTGGLLTNGLLISYSAVNDRMRDMTRERLEIRRGPRGEVLEHIPAIDQERLAEIEAQLPMMLRRHHLIRDAVLLVYSGIGVLGLSIIFIAVAVDEGSEGFGRAALGLVLAGIVVMLTGLLLAGISMARSADAITYAVQRTRRLGLPVSLADSRAYG